MKKRLFNIWMALPLTALMLFFTTCYQADENEAPIMQLPPLKDQFSAYFDIGNIFNPNDAGRSISNSRLTRHYNVLTAENDMKPDKLNPNRGSYNFSTANNMVNAARASGFKVVGHTLLWHSQIPAWQAALRTDSTSREDALRYMNEYITRVVGEFKERIYKWDVLNEVFPDGVSANGSWRTSMRSGPQGNPWFMKIGADFVYEGFLAARLADPSAILYYNDYNMNNVGKSTMVRNMVRDVNVQYLANLPAIRAANPSVNLDRTEKLIEGIGMQGHHNTGVSADSIRAALNLFRPLGVRISISELDVLSQTWDEFDRQQARPTDAGKARAAELYGEYFTVFLENSDIIERVSFWGVYDEQSWRARGLPLIFEGISNTRPKASYYKIIEALEAFRP